MDKEREAHCDQLGIAEAQEGAEIGEQVIAAFSPSIHQHIHRFGRYQLDLTQPPPLNYAILVVISKKETSGFVASEAQKKVKARQKKKESTRQMRLFS